MTAPNIGRANQLEIMSFIAKVGVATQNQLQRLEIVRRQNLDDQLARLVATGWIDEPKPRHHYAGAKGRVSSLYRLTEMGARELITEGYEGISKGRKGLKDNAAIDHALAMLDCYQTLVECLEVRSIATDKTIPYGRSVIRPDNLAILRDGSLPIMVETEGEGKLYRITKKLQNLVEFFNSAQGKNYDPNIRIIYLWRADRHARM